MFRVIIAAFLLRSIGANVEYVVRRKSAQREGKGTTLLTATKLSVARTKYRNVRVADTDTITISVEAIIAQRHGGVSASGSLSQKEKRND